MLPPKPDSPQEHPGQFHPSRELSVRDLTVAFGGLMAVERVSLNVRPGQITGLIGPNGAGKTTLFNACSGLVIPNSGSFWLGDRDLTRMSAAKRARAGLGRTFQQPELCNSLTVADNIMIGSEAKLAATN